jgi:YegS/Rv2252/BmrU family lipid kinase
MVSGLIKNNLYPKIGYIPSGSTNDFATGLHLPQNPLDAIKNIVEGKAVTLDAGIFNDRIFIYTASFGIFTKASYNTPRDLKNTLGYLAYVLEGSKEIMDVQPVFLKAESNNHSVEGKYIFGAVCNTKQIGGGLLKFDDNTVDMSDGLLEVLLVKFPKNPAEVMQIIFDAKSGKYNSNMFDFFSADEVTITTENDIDWTIDGEYQKGNKKINIKTLNSAIHLISNNKIENEKKLLT